MKNKNNFFLLKGKIEKKSIQQKAKNKRMRIKLKKIIYDKLRLKDKIKNK
jgi:hypothetical protein